MKSYKYIKVKYPDFIIRAFVPRAAAASRRVRLGLGPEAVELAVVDRPVVAAVYTYIHTHTQRMILYIYICIYNIHIFGEWRVVGKRRKNGRTEEECEGGWRNGMEGGREDKGKEGR
jgi:hypothetical protein